MTMNMTRKITTHFVGIALIGAAVSGQVFAADSTDAARTRAVNYADLNMGSQAGIAALYQRIHQAAKKVCDESDAGRNLQSIAAQNSCIARAESNAVSDVRSGALSAYYEKTLGQTYAVSASNNVK
jgi:UrcA family protein